MPKITIPDNMICSLSHELFKEPVVAEDGITYEKLVIEKWLKKNDTSPTTQEKISLKLIPNVDKRKQIIEFKEKNKICSTEKLFELVMKGALKEIQEINYLESDLEARDKNDLTLLDWAVYERDYEMLKWLIGQGADVNTGNTQNLMPLHRAVAVKKSIYFINPYKNLFSIRSTDMEIVTLLLANNAKIEAKDSNGRTPLAIAIEENQSLELCKLLLEKNANSKTIDNKGNTLLHLAAKQRAQFFFSLFEKKDFQGPYDSMMAYQTDQESKLVDVVKIILSKWGNENIDSKNLESLTPLQLAVKNLHDGLVDLLLTNGANVNSVDSTGFTALHSLMVQPLLDPSETFAITEDTLKIKTKLAEQKRIGIFQRLLKANPNLDAKDLLGNTPLHLAALHGQATLVKQLLTNGANQNVLNNSGQTPAQAAEQIGKPEMAIFFSDYSLEKKMMSLVAPKFEELEKQIKAQQLLIQELRLEVNQYKKQIQEMSTSKKLVSEPTAEDPRIQQLQEQIRQLSIQMQESMTDKKPTDTSPSLSPLTTASMSFFNNPENLDTSVPKNPTPAFNIGTGSSYGSRRITKWHYTKSGANVSESPEPQSSNNNAPSKTQ